VKSAGAWTLRLLRGFGRFWWDFLVGDTPEIFVAALVVLGVVALISLVGHLNTLAVVALPLLAILTLGLSVLRASRAGRR
jgi:hypothetical protein